MKIPKSLYSRLALITSVTLVVGYFVVYAAYQTFQAEEYQSGAQLSSTFLGKIVSNLDEINGKISNFGFSAGNIGIGTASPSAKLNVLDGIIRATTSGSHSFDIEPNTAGGWTKIGNTGAQPLIIQSNGGNVGIGTTTPTYKLSLTQGVGVITSSATVNDYYLPVTTGGAKLGVPDNIATALFKSGYDAVFTLTIVAKYNAANQYVKTYNVYILYGSPLITQISAHSYGTIINPPTLAYDNATRTIRATIDTTGGQTTDVYWSISGLAGLNSSDGKFEIQ